MAKDKPEDPAEDARKALERELGKALKEEKDAEPVRRAGRSKLVQDALARRRKR
jgi:hypothetical protein